MAMLRIWSGFSRWLSRFGLGGFRVEHLFYSKFSFSIQGRIKVGGRECWWGRRTQWWRFASDQAGLAPMLDVPSPGWLTAFFGCDCHGVLLYLDAEHADHAEYLDHAEIKWLKMENTLVGNLGWIKVVRGQYVWEWIYRGLWIRSQKTHSVRNCWTLVVWRLDVLKASFSVWPTCDSSRASRNRSLASPPASGEEEILIAIYSRWENWHLNGEFSVD